FRRQGSLRLRHARPPPAHQSPALLPPRPFSFIRPGSPTGSPALPLPAPLLRRRRLLARLLSRRLTLLPHRVLERLDGRLQDRERILRLRLLPRPAAPQLLARRGRRRLREGVGVHAERVRSPPSMLLELPGVVL